MQLSEDMFCKMEYSEEDIKIEEVSIVDDEEFSDTSSEDQTLRENMIFTQIYIPREGEIQEYLASPSPSEMNFKNRPGRKQKLEHLTFEEKLLRKKLKNREAAQTSRDRKKARMTELEIQVRYLQQQNERLRSEKDNACKENERLKLELTKPSSTDEPSPGAGDPATPHPLTQPSRSAATLSAEVNPRAAPHIKRGSAEFLELSPQQTASSMQRAPRGVVNSLDCVACLKQEVVSMVSLVATLLLVVVMSSQPAGQKQKTGTGSWILRRAQLQSAFSNLSRSQQVYLSQLLLIIAKELKQVPQSLNLEATGWNPVNFLHSNVPLFLQHIPPVPPAPPQARPLPSLAMLVEASMKKVPIPS